MDRYGAALEKARITHDSHMNSEPLLPWPKYVPAAKEVVGDEVAEDKEDPSEEDLIADVDTETTAFSE